MFTIAISVSTYENETLVECFKGMSFPPDGRKMISNLAYGKNDVPQWVIYMGIFTHTFNGYLMGAEF